MASMPFTTAGQRIGLMGGSFDPSHEGHRHITRLALQRFALDRVWWLVSPHNPLKPTLPNLSIAERMERACAIAQHPRVTVSDLELYLGTRATIDTLLALKTYYPHVRFIWLMGADNFVNFHLWHRWKAIFETVPIGVLPRAGQNLAARTSIAARAFRPYRIPDRQSHLLGTARAPAWCFVDAPMINQSSTALRAKGAE